MSLDISLYAMRETEVHWSNITHNLGKMASEAGVYDCLWRAPENGFETAAQLIEPLKAGLELLKSDPERFKVLNPSNGWGDYEGFVEFVEEVLSGCVKNPDARIYTSR